MARTKAEKAQGFEDSLNALEKIVAQLEAGDLPLDHALEIFEDGVGLARRCQSQLAEAERKVELLLREHGELKVVPFEAGQAVQSGITSVQPQIRHSAVATAGSDDRENSEESGKSTGDNLDDDMPF